MPASKKRRSAAAPARSATAAAAKSIEPSPAAALRTLGSVGVLMFAAVGALAFALAFPPFDLWPLACLAPAPLAWIAVRAKSARAAIAIPFIIQSLMWLWLNRWIIPVTTVGYPALGIYMSFWPAAFIWIIRRIGAHPGLRRAPMTLIVPITWTALEYLRGDLAFNGYSWYLLAHPMIAWTAFVQSAGLLGTYFISFLCAAASGLIVDAALERVSRRLPDAPDRNARSIAGVRAAAVILLIAFAANLAYGFARLSSNAGDGRIVRILAIQTNLPQNNKSGWKEEEQARDLPAFIALTRRAVASCAARPDLVVWPETMVPGLGFEPQTLADLEHFGDMGDRETRWPRAIAALSRELGIPMLIGSDAWIGTEIVPGEGDKIVLKKKFNYNSAFLVDPDGRAVQRYDKVFLTPFGETMPYISNWKWLEERMLAFGARGMSFSLDAAPDVRLLELRTGGGPVRIATPICFEDTVGWLCRRMAYEGGGRRADVFINISNDGWFAGAVADRRLHAQVARFRCIETGVPMVRCVNTGNSVRIDPCGRLRGAVGDGKGGYGAANQEGWLAAEAELSTRDTLYGRIGESFPALCLIGALGGLCMTFLKFRGETRT